MEKNQDRRPRCPHCNRIMGPIPNSLAKITDEELHRVLPCGVVIDSRWRISRSANGNIRCRNSSHLEDCDGGYDGWQSFTVVLFVVGGKTRRIYPAGLKPGDIAMRIELNEPRAKRKSADGLRYDLYKIIRPVLTTAKIIDGCLKDSPGTKPRDMNILATIPTG